MKKAIVIMLFVLLATVGVLADALTSEAESITPPSDPYSIQAVEHLISPLKAPHRQYFPNGWVDLFGENAGLESGEYRWEMYPPGQVFNVGNDAREGEHVHIQGESDPRTSEVAYRCWAPEDLEGYLNFHLQDSWHCESNDIHYLNEQKLWFIYYDPGADEWRRITDYFGPLSHTDCNPWVHWEDEAFHIQGLEAYRGYTVCLAIGAEFPGIFNSYFWRDFWMLLGQESMARLMFPHIGKNY